MADDGPAAACPAACPAASSSPPPLFDRIGGMRALINAVDVFYARILADPTLAPFFEGVEMSRQRTKQVSFFFLSIFRFFVFRQPPFFFFFPFKKKKKKKISRSSSSATPLAAPGSTWASRSPRRTSA